MFIFDQPLWFLLVLLWPVGYYLSRRGKSGSTVLSLPTASALTGSGSWRMEARKRLSWLRHAALLLLIIAMARPQMMWEEARVDADGIDIMLALDISPSMLSRDFVPDRLSVAKKVAVDFVKKRPNDRIGLVVFSAEAFTHCPLTPDKKVVEQFINEVEVGVLPDGTAIGTGLATALNRLKNSPGKSKIVVLLTDGENNAGSVSPEDAARIATEMGVKVYTVGMGKEGWVESPVSRFPDGSYAFDMRMSVINTDLLEEIARETKGRFFRAYTPDDLSEIYGEIDRLEKTKTEVTTIRHTTDYFFSLLLAAFIIVLLEMSLRWGILRSATP